MQPLFIDLVLHRVVCFVGPHSEDRPKGPLGFVRGYTSVLEMVSQGMRDMFHARLKLEVHCAGLSTAGHWRAQNYDCEPHEQWRRYDTDGKVRWVRTYTDWGDYGNEEDIYGAYRGRIQYMMCDY